MTLPSTQEPLARVFEDAPVVHIVDDDEGWRSSLAFLLQSVGVVALTYPDAITFLEELDDDEPSVVILEARMRGLSGLQLQERLALRNYPAPVLFCSAHGDIATTVRAMRAGAVGFLEKPYDPQMMLETVQEQILEAKTAFLEREGSRAVEARIGSLTPREREVLRLVMDGLPSQQIASLLGASVKTIDVHRARIRAKADADSLGCLVRDLFRHRITL